MAKIAPESAPGQQQMDQQQHLDVLDKFFENKNALLVKQTMRGCCQECMGCEAKSEYKIQEMKWEDMENAWKVREDVMNRKEEMYAREDSSFLCRLCWRDGRSFLMNVSSGDEAGGQRIIDFEKPCGFPLYFYIQTDSKSIDVPCCCLLPEVFTKFPDGDKTGSKSRYICDQNCWVPKLHYDEDGKTVYVLRPETCCCGCCIMCRCCSKRGPFIPFFFHDPDTNKPVGGKYTDDNTPQIRKVWAGWKKECCSTADTFAVFFPEGIDAKRKAGLLGLTFLLDFTIFERQAQ